MEEEGKKYKEEDIEEVSVRTRSSQSVNHKDYTPRSALYHAPSDTSPGNFSGQTSTLTLFLFRKSPNSAYILASGTRFVDVPLATFPSGCP